MTQVWTYSLRLPWVVMDLNILRSLPASEGLPGNFTVTIPDRLFHEVADGDTPKALVRKIDRLLSHPGSHRRIAIPLYWEEIAGSESTPRQVELGSRWLLNIPLSATLRERQESTEAIFLPDADWSIERDQRKDAFIKLTRDYEHYIRTHAPHVAKTHKADGRAARQAAMKQAAEALGTYQAALHVNKKYAKRAWRKLLTSFPARCAFARWHHTIFYYALKYVEKDGASDDTRGNDFDDAFYLFTALYTNHLWTADKGLAEAARCVSGGRIRVHSCANSIPTHYSEVAVEYWRKD